MSTGNKDNAPSLAVTYIVTNWLDQLAPLQSNAATHVSANLFRTKLSHKFKKNPSHHAVKNEADGKKTRRKKKTSGGTKCTYVRQQFRASDRMRSDPDAAGTLLQTKPRGQPARLLRKSSHESAEHCHSRKRGSIRLRLKRGQRTTQE